MGKKKKAKSDRVVVGFCLDESGSMGAVLDVTLSGFNEYLGDLRRQEGATTLSLTMFSDRPAPPGMPASACRPHSVAADVRKVNDLDRTTYTPGGGTPLFDAIGTTIRQLERQLADEQGDPAVVFVIQTDGQENSSREFTRQMIVDLIREKEAAGWSFLYLGADQDEYEAETISTGMGISAGASLAYARGAQGASGPVGAFGAVGAATATVRMASMAGHAVDSTEAGAAMRNDYRDRVEQDSKSKKRDKSKPTYLR